MGRAIGPDMDLAHGADGAGRDPFFDQPVALERHALVAHLGGYLARAAALAMARAS